jgi:hypothetical protein
MAHGKRPWLKSKVLGHHKPQIGRSARACACMPTSFREVGTLKTKRKTLWGQPSRCQGTKESSPVSWARMGSSSKGVLKRKMMTDGIDDGARGVHMTFVRRRRSVDPSGEGEWQWQLSWMEKGGGCNHVARSEGAASNLCRRNGSGDWGGPRMRIRETLVLKYIDHFRSTCKIYLTDKLVFFSTVFVITCGSRPCLRPHRSTKNMSNWFYAHDQVGKSCPLSFLV